MINEKEKLRRRAHWVARHDLKSCHDVWTTCKVAYSHPHVFNFVFEFLQLGYSAQQIEKVYNKQLREWHTKGSDMGKVLKPSGLVSAVRVDLLKLMPDFDFDEYQENKERIRTQQEEKSKNRFSALCKQYGIKQF